jgi:tetratricopeptide (TPR) repeat protein
MLYRSLLITVISFKKILQYTITLTALVGLGITISVIQWDYQKHQIIASRIDRHKEQLLRQKGDLQDLLAKSKATLRANEELIQRALAKVSRLKEVESNYPLDPEVEKVEMLLSKGWLGYNQAERLLTTFRERLDHEPNNPLVLGTLARIYQKLGNYSQSVRYYNRALKFMEEADERRLSYVDQLTDIYTTMGLARRTLPLREKVAGEETTRSGTDTLR